MCWHLSPCVPLDLKAIAWSFCLLSLLCSSPVQPIKWALREQPLGPEGLRCCSKPLVLLPQEGLGPSCRTSAASWCQAGSGCACCRGWSSSIAFPWLRSKQGWGLKPGWRNKSLWTSLSRFLVDRFAQPVSVWCSEGSATRG